jgi:rRNA-processing protein FCF1
MVIAVFDNDVLVYIFDTVYYSDKRKVRKVMEYLALRYFRIWIPRTVKREFLRLKKRKKIYYRYLKRYNNLIEECPITISTNDIYLLLTPEIHEGEADGILQTQKAPMHRSYSTHQFIFVSNDKKAINTARRMGIEVLRFTEIQNQLREGGIIV